MRASEGAGRRGRKELAITERSSDSSVHFASLPRALLLSARNIPLPHAFAWRIMTFLLENVVKYFNCVSLLPKIFRPSFGSLLECDAAHSPTSSSVRNVEQDERGELERLWYGLICCRIAVFAFGAIDGVDRWR